jgi:diaminopimelate decarboxylase
MADKPTTTKTLPCSDQQLARIIERHPTPFHLYDARGVRESARALARAFAWAPGFREYFAVKATPNPHILALLAAEGCGMDCSSLPELLLAERVGIAGESIMFSSNNTPASEFQQARRLGALINLDDLAHLDYIERHAGLPELVCFRYNPGSLREGNLIIGRPEEAKFGCTRAQLAAGYAAARARGVRRFGIHTMLASNELDPDYFVATARMLFELVAKLSAELDIRFEFANLGGGIGIPYHPEQRPVDLERVSAGVRAAYAELIAGNRLDPLRIFFECGRLISGPHGWLVTTVRHVKHTYKQFVGVDATMADLMRPAIYGAYHHITVLGKAELPADQRYDVTGSLCENNDKFAIDRALPEVTPSDVLVIHDTGAHGHAMGFNYNGKLRAAELLLHADGAVAQIRRAETVEDYFATLDFPPREPL